MLFYPYFIEEKTKAQSHATRKCQDRVQAPASLNLMLDLSIETLEPNTSLALPLGVGSKGCSTFLPKSPVFAEKAEKKIQALHLVLVSHDAVTKPSSF